MQPLNYAGDVSPKTSWEMMENDPAAHMVDVRTPEEWAYVGIPNLSSIEREVFFVPWLFFPRGDINPDFVAQIIESTGATPDTTILLLCRSGVRSAYGAQAMTQAGFKDCYNVAHGFEGDKDQHGHRGTVNGWKVDGLPWAQG